MIDLLEMMKEETYEILVYLSKTRFKDVFLFRYYFLLWKIFFVI